jgi:GxxExxY protein
MRHELNKEDLNKLTESIIAAAIEVHRTLGPGMLESAYDACLSFELADRGFHVDRQRSMPLVYRGRRLDVGYRLDLLVEDSVIVEVKAVERIEPVHFGQLTSYLRLTGCKVGLLINFNVKWLVQDGIKRIVNGFPD